MAETSGLRPIGPREWYLRNNPWRVYRCSCGDPHCPMNRRPEAER